MITRKAPASREFQSLDKAIQMSKVELEITLYGRSTASRMFQNLCQAILVFELEVTLLGKTLASRKFQSLGQTI